MNKKVPKLLVQFVDRDKPPILSPDGNSYYQSHWEVRDEINLGSMKHPNLDVAYLKILPLQEMKYD